jgi:hypothetical protein
MHKAPVWATALAIFSVSSLAAFADDIVPRPPARAAAPSAQNRKENQGSDTLLALNDASRAAYRRAREEALAHCGPVVLVEGDEMVLVYGIYRSTVHITPARYGTLKSVSHIPLAVHALLDGCVGAAIEDQRLYDLKQYCALVARAAEGLVDRGLDAEELKRAKTIIDESLTLLARIIEAHRVEGKQLDEYRHRMRPVLEANAAQAARAQIDSLDRQMKAWKSRLTDAEWKRLHVIVMGSQLPRRGNLGVQYFARLLGEAGEGKRVVYAEAIFDEPRALDLLVAGTPKRLAGCPG